MCARKGFGELREIFFIFFVIRVFGQEGRIVLWLKASFLRD